MSTTVIRMSGPLMAWPRPDRFNVRGTEAVPTYSAMLGMLAAAAGVARTDPIPRFLTEAQLVARVDDPGVLLADYHTVNPRPAGRYRWLGEKDTKRAVATVSRGNESSSFPRRPAAASETIVTRRFYRSGATVVMFVDDPDGRIADAVARPRWAFYAGRKACVLSFPVLLGTTGRAPVDAAATVPSAVLSVPEHSSMWAVTFGEDAGVVRSDGVAGSFAAARVPLTSTVTSVSPRRVRSWMDVAGWLRGRS